MAEAIDSANDQTIPGTPGIKEIRSDTGPEKFSGHGACGAPSACIRRFGSRAVIDTSPPFGSVKEAVTRFGGSGPWLPLYKLGETYVSSSFILVGFGNFYVCFLVILVTKKLFDLYIFVTL